MFAAASGRLFQAISEVALLRVRAAVIEADHAAMKAQVDEIHSVLTRRGGAGSAPLPSQPIALAESPTRGRRSGPMTACAWSRSTERSRCSTS